MNFRHKKNNLLCTLQCQGVW